MASSQHGSEARIVDAAGLTKTFSDFWMRATARSAMRCWHPTRTTGNPGWPI